MEKQSTVNVVGGDRAGEIVRAIIDTHKYLIQNVAILNDRERGYFFNEYFPTVKRYLEDPLKVLVPMESPIDAAIFTEEFRYLKDIQLLGFSLSYIPKEIKGVYIAKDRTGFDRKDRYRLSPGVMDYVGDYTYDLATGNINFAKFFLLEFNAKNLANVLKAVKVTQHFSIFIEYTKTEGQTKTKYGKRYEVGTDGEN